VAAGGITEAEFAGWQDEGRQMAYEPLLQYAARELTAVADGAA